MTGASVIDELWIRLGIRAEGDGLKNIKSQVNEAKQSLLSAGTALKAFITGFAVKEIADIGSTFEQNQIQIAGFLSALGQSSDFNAGLKDAADTINSITLAAAKLPGEADVYIEVFKSGLPFVQAALPGASLGRMTDFTNHLTAIGKAMKLPADLIGREISEILAPGQGNAQKRLPLFRMFLPLMQQLQGQAHLTAESFNAMTAPKRAELLMGVFGKLQPMLDASSNSFDAMWGGAVSNLKQITRMMSKPLFEGMKKGLDQINNLLFDKKGRLTPFAQHIVDGVQKAMGYLTQFMELGGQLIRWFATSRVGAAALKTALGLLGLALAGLAVEKTVGSFTKLLGLLTNMKALLGGALFTAIALIAEDLYQFYTGGNSVTGLLVEKFAPALDLVKLALIGLSTAFLALNANPFIAAIYGGFMLGEVLGDIIYKMGVLGALEPKALRDFKSPETFDRSGASSATEDTDTSFLQKREPRTRTLLSGAIATLRHSQMHTWNPSQSMDSGTGAVTNNNISTTSNPVMHFHIQSHDPTGAAEEVSRVLTRNAQTKTKL